MRLVHRLVRQHGLADDVADGEDVGHVGAHLDVDVDEATVRDRHAGLVGSDLLAVGRAAHGLQHQVVELGCGGSAALFRWRKGHFDAFGQGACRDGLGLEHDVVEALGVHLLPDLDQVAVGALHQAVHHFDHVQAGAQRAVHRAHFQADDAATQNQHALGHFLERQGSGGVHDARVVGHEGQTHSLRAGRNDGALECDDLLGAGLLLGRAGGFFHFEVVGTDEVTVAADGGDLAHLGHGSQAAGQLADDLFFVAAQLVDVDHGRTEVNTQVGHVADFVHDGGHVQQGLRGDATHVQAHAAQGRVTLDHDDFEAQVCCAEGRGVAAGATAEHQHVALQIRTSGEATGRGSRSCRRYLFNSYRGNIYLGHRGILHRIGRFSLQSEHHAAHGHFVAQLHLEFAHHTCLAARDFHGCFVTLHGDQALLFAHAISGLDHQLNHSHFCEVTNVRNLDFYDRHTYLYSVGGRAPLLRKVV
ncbi:MAG: hypothetical protein BWX79_01871 [Alphaproteobacteria bacterium ADurb.Bin100]|nr:MAG: hypothetical protein BWX79_01871 [Alphaproteobacteria bacterium ADurb.Bin100]